MITDTTIATGKDAVLAMRQQILDSRPEVLRLITAFDNFRKCFSVEERIALTTARRDAGISARVIFSSSSPEVESQPLPEDYIWFLHNTLPVCVDTYIYNDTVSTVDMTNPEEPTVRTVKNEAYACSMRALFDHIWQQQSSVV